MRATEQINVSDWDLNRVQDNIVRWTRQFMDREIIDGVLIKRAVLVSGVDYFLKHGLGRKWQGWILTRKSANADVYESSTTNNVPDSTIILKSSANVTIDLWVF